MSQPESLKSRIIQVGWTPPAARSNGHRSVTAPLAPVTQILAPAPRVEVTRAEPEPPREVITTLALSSPVMVIEDVQLTAPFDRRLILLNEPGSARARSFRLLQHRLAAEHDPRIIAVTSALPGEGKTTCAANLALVLAETSFARVLLLDANLKRPSIADVFGYEPVDNLMTKLLRNEDVSAPYAVASTSST
ncbi:MAG TPA: P-loop NTPase, partial [Polyangiaceae bacterium]|nr:P-loop NTPase [Polyangiaceae bacterium]